MGMSAYWAQYSHQEIMSMYGVEDEYLDDELDYDYDSEDVDDDDSCYASMDSLGLSERDFM